MTGEITAASVKREFLHPAMDGRALNLEQAELLANPSRPVDSLIEILTELAAGFGPHPLIIAATRMVEEIDASNEIEGEAHRRIAGTADQMVRDLRRAELQGASEALGAKAIARRLRQPLAVLARIDGRPVDELVDASRILGEVLAIAPRTQLLSPAVEYELGKRKFAALCSHLESLDAAQLRTAGVTAPRTGSERDGS